MSKAASLAFVVTGCIFACVTSSSAESGYEAWLRYEPAAPETRSLYRDIPKTLVCYGSSELIRSAADELSRGCKSMLGLAIEAAQTPGGQGCLVLGRVELLTNSFRSLSMPGVLQPDSFLLRTVRAGGRTDIFIAGADDRAVLYGVFALLRRVALGQGIDPMDETHIPSAPIRVLNHWDNLDGSIERGYAGKSIFWDHDHVSEDLRRLRDYARLMASVGINGCSINNVNADGRMLTPEFLAQVARIASEFRPWGVRVLISIDFAAPRKIGGLTTFDPLDPAVVEFWKRKVDEVYGVVPDLGGFILKADSEGRLGPSAYGRTHADAANMIAAALRPHKGLLFYRGFVYDHHMDWRNLKLDRAKAAYDNFHPLDGRFLDNVVVQIKHGPIDFQVREPVSPLFGALDRTCQAVELQITQEYTGQQRHLCYLVPMWKQVLDFDLHANGSETPVKSIVAGKTFKRATGGFVGVSNVGRDTNWLGHDLAVANLYGFGRLAWNPDLSPKQIAEEWARLTFGADPVVNQTVVRLEIDSWPAYESYTGPLGAGTLTDILGPHYG